MFELYDLIGNKIVAILATKERDDIKVYHANSVPKNAPNLYITYNLEFSNKSYEERIYILNLMIHGRKNKTNSNINKDLIDIASFFEVVENYEQTNNDGFIETNIIGNDLAIRINELSGTQLLSSQDISGEIMNGYQLVFILSVRDNRG